VHGSFLYGDNPADLDIDVYIKGTSMTRELLAGEKAAAYFDEEYGMNPLPLHASAFGLDRDSNAPSVNDSFLTTAFWNGLPVWGDAEPETPGVIDRLRSIEEYLGFIEVKRHENRFDKTKGYLIGFIYFLYAQSADPDLKGAIAKELDAIEAPGKDVTPQDADRIIALARGWFDRLARSMMDSDRYEINFEYKGGYVGVAAVYLRTAREKIRRTIFRNLGAWALMRTAIILYLAVRQAAPTATRTPAETTLLELSSELDTLRKKPFTPDIRARLLEIERQLTEIQRDIAAKERAALDAQEKAAWEQFELDIAGARAATEKKIQKIHGMRDNLDGRRLKEADDTPGPPVQPKAAPNPLVASVLIAAGWLALFAGLDPSPLSAAALLILPAVGALLFLGYGRALEGTFGIGAAPSPVAVSRWVSERFGLSLVWISEDDWLSGAMSSPYAEVRGTTLLIRERAAGNLLALSLLLAHEAIGERLLSRGPSWLYSSAVGRFTRESVATFAEVIFAVPMLLSLRRLAAGSAGASTAPGLASVADEVIALGRARVAGAIINGDLPGVEVVSWDIGGPVAGTSPAGRVTAGDLERLPAIIAERMEAQVRSGILAGVEAEAVRSAIGDWLGKPVELDGKTFEFVARRIDLTESVLNRLAARRDRGLTDTVYVDAAEQAADPGFFEDLRRRGLTVVAVERLIDSDRNEIRLAALGDVLRQWDDARRRNAILTYSRNLSFEMDPAESLLRLADGVSVVTIETLINAIDASLRSVIAQPLSTLIQAARLAAAQA